METIDSSVHTDKTGNKRIKLQHKEDRISDLPDSIIQHILSFLPSTKESIQTGILSKRWRYQWSRVPVLIFDFEYCQDENSPRWIDNALILYDSSKMKKFHVAYSDDFECDNNFTSKLLFATRKNVEELLLDYGCSMVNMDPYMLPEFILDNTFLVKLKFLGCEFQLSKRVNWPSLKALTMTCYFLKDDDINGSIENVLSGSPLLESLELSFLLMKSPVTIASKSLKILRFIDNVDIANHLEISCPKLEELFCRVDHQFGPPIFPRKTILSVLSGSPLFHSLELNCFFEPLGEIEIRCPNLEMLIWCDSDFEKCKLINLPASCRTTLDFVTPELEGCDDNLARKILVELQTVKELNVRDWFVKVLSALKTEELPNPSLNVKYLTLNYPNFRHLLGILNALRCSPVLERLVINLHVYQQYQKTADLDLKYESSQIPEGSVYANSVYHLKTVKIIGLSKKDIQCNVVLCFVAFLLKNARALKKMTVILKDGGKDNFLTEVSQILLGIKRYSQHAIVELL